MSRGGSRQGRKGVAYKQRTDLNTVKPLPVTTVPDQPYGAAKAQADAQSVVPMQGGLPTPSVLNGQQSEPTGPMPGELPSLTAPSSRPDEPVTHGMPLGPGGGTDIFPTAPDPVLKGLAILNSLGDRLPPELKAVQAYLDTMQNNGVNG